MSTFRKRIGSATWGFLVRGQRWRKAAQLDDGAAMLEFALTSIVLLILVLGIMEMCLAVYSFHLISEAAREGSRYAMVRGDSCEVNGASCTASTAQIQSFVQNLGLPAINPENVSVSVTYSAYPAGSSCTPNANCANPGNLVTVKVTYPFPLSIPFLPSTTLNMKSTSAMVISQ